MDTLNHHCNPMRLVIYYPHSPVENTEAHGGQATSLGLSQLARDSWDSDPCGPPLEATCSTTTLYGVLCQRRGWICLFCCVFPPFPNGSSVLSPPQQCPHEQKEGPQPGKIPLSGWTRKPRPPGSLSHVWSPEPPPAPGREEDTLGLPATNQP